MAMTTFTLGWPFTSVTVSVPEEVTRTVVDTVQVPVQVTRWIFFKSTRLEAQEVPKEITETIVRTGSRDVFSPSLLLFQAGIGLIAFYAQLWLIHGLWRLRG